METTLQACAGIGLLILAYYFYTDVKGKKPLSPGDNRFFNEVPNGIMMIDFYRTWCLIIVFLVSGISLFADLLIP